MPQTRKPQATLGSLAADPSQDAQLLFNPERKREISRLSGIPEDEPDAWKLIETIVGIYRSRKHKAGEALRSSKVRRELERQAAAAWTMWSELSELADRCPIDLGLNLNHILGQLRGVEIFLHQLAKSVGPGRSGPAAGDQYKLVEMLDGIRHEFTCKELKRSGKRTDSSREFITVVCRIADPQMGQGTIERAMKRTIQRRRKRLQEKAKSLYAVKITRKSPFKK